jgi:hypothetical protein
LTWINSLFGGRLMVPFGLNLAPGAVADNRRGVTMAKRKTDVGIEEAGDEPAGIEEDDLEEEGVEEPGVEEDGIEQIEKP